MKYKAVFFDRDGTLVHNDPRWEKLREEKIFEWSGKRLNTTDEYFMKFFMKVMNGGFPFAPYRDTEQEIEFFRQWYIFVFEDMGITEHVQERADFLTERLWYWKKVLFPETEEVLKYFKEKGYKMGVISDCPPSLEMTLKTCKIAEYFTSFTASSVVGAGKPHPKIFNAALSAQGVSVSESIYVDDCEEEADGAGALGFTSFYLDRTGRCTKASAIHSLSDLVKFAEQA